MQVIHEVLAYLLAQAQGKSEQKEEEATHSASTTKYVCGIAVKSPNPSSLSDVFLKMGSVVFV